MGIFYQQVTEGQFIKKERGNERLSSNGMADDENLIHTSLNPQKQKRLDLTQPPLKLANVAYFAATCKTICAPLSNLIFLLAE